MNIGKTIKNLRNQKGISQVDLASRVGVSKQTLYKYENEIISNIPSDKIESLAAELGTTPSRLMGWDSYEDSQIAQRDMALDSIRDLLNKNNREDAHMGQSEMAKAISRRLLNAINGSQLSYSEIEKLSGVPKSAIQRYANNLTNSIPIDRLVAICKAISVDPKSIIGWDAQPNLVENHSLPPSENGIAIGKCRIPIVATVAAGEPTYSEGNVEGWIDYDKDPRGHVFACRIKGDSMSPRIQDGDIIIVDQEADFEDGDIVLVTVNGNDGTCKRIKKYTDCLALLSLNPAYEPMIYTSKEVRALPVEIKGKVVEFRARF